ncbi:hypothetical protein TSOC_000010 [Tetrabaena socialis]|uniref:Ankyrin repeat domain-containing protein n=1 Tax=Tetrabaena socialis TaxID=47790 RepID=A0A2J8AKB8_9CHLO|nr:hypothetical protein TSOC_000010 [Tetrabaena socialis]|eukprot:PNH12964.1 hypothetical protein TSOC_000010 [Tetrabaena socialis]
MEPERAPKRQRTTAAPPSPQPQPAAAAAPDPSCLWQPDLVQRFAVASAPNDVACLLRLVNKATAAQLTGAQHTTVHLSQPVPRREFAWRWAPAGAVRDLTRQQRADLACLTARGGSTANLEVLLARDDVSTPVNADTFAAAAGDGRLEACIWIRQQGCPRLRDSDALEAAAEGGHEAVCEWLIAEDCPKRLRLAAAAVAAASGGHTGLMDRLLAAAGPPNVRELLNAAAAGCDLRTLQRLPHTYLDSRSRGALCGDEDPLLASAAGSCTTDWLAKAEWLEARGYSWTEEACARAAGAPDALARLVWLRQRGCPVDSGAAVSAARQGDVGALRYLLGQRGCALRTLPAAMWAAAKRGQVAAMQALHDRGVRGNEDMLRLAASRGHTRAVAWLAKALGVASALTPELFASAAESGSIGLLAWLRGKGCLWGADVLAVAAAEGSEEQLEWLAAQGCPMGVGTG